MKNHFGACSQSHLRRKTVDFGQIFLFLILFVAPDAWATVYSFAVIGDTGLWNEAAQETRKSIHSTRIRELILPGDNIYEGNSYDAIWSHWVEQGFNFGVVAIGNHNIGYEKEIKYFRMPGEAYSKTYGHDARLVVLNSDDVATTGQQAAWLDHELTEAKEPFIFIVFHHPPYTISKGHIWQEKQGFHLAIRPLIWKHRQKLAGLILGHDHIAGLLTFGDLPIIVSGAGAQTSKPIMVDNMQDGVRVHTQWIFDATPHWTELDLDTTTGLVWIHYIQSSTNKVSCSVNFTPHGRGKVWPNCLTNR